MDDIYSSGIQFILWLQSLGEWIAYPMLFFSLLGTEIFYILIAPAIYWLWNPALGLRLGLFLNLSGAINNILKITFHQPRPYWYDKAVKAYTAESSYSIPSGHAQNAVVTWGTLAYYLPRKWGKTIAILLIFLISISRIFLGVHFPSDVLVGWLIGLVLLWAMIRLEAPVLEWMKKQSLGIQILTIFLASLSIILFGYLALATQGDWIVPPQWVEYAQLAFPDQAPINPQSLSRVVTSAGAFFGMALGGLWMYQKGGFSVKGLWWQLILRFIVGLIGALLIWLGLDMIFPDGETLIPVLLRFIRYALVGLWITALAPMLFIKTRLISSHENSI